MAMTTEHPRRLVSIPETRHILGDVGRTKVYGLMDNGELERVKVGSRAFVTSTSIDRYLDRLSDAAAAEGARDSEKAGP